MAKADPSKWLGNFRAALNQAVDQDLSDESCQAALKILRAAYAHDQGLGPGWEEALRDSARAGFAPGVECLMDIEVPLPDIQWLAARRLMRRTWVDHASSLGSASVSVYGITSPAGRHPSKITPPVFEANRRVIYRLYLDPAMPVCVWKELVDLARADNAKLSTRILQEGKIEPLRSSSSLSGMLDLVRSKTIRHRLIDIVLAFSPDRPDSSPTFPQTVFRQWINQSPNLAKKGEAGLSCLFGLIQEDTGSPSQYALARSPGSGSLLCTLDLMERSGYTPKQIFKGAKTYLDATLPVMAIKENEPAVIHWLLDRGYDLSGNHRIKNYWSDQFDCEGLPPDSFWHAMVLRLQNTHRRSPEVNGKPAGLDDWWGCVHRIMHPASAQTLLQLHLKNATVKFQSPELQEAWDSSVGHARLLKSVDQAPEPPAQGPSPRRL